MANTIFLAGWEVEGLRCPDHKISLEKAPEQVHAVSLIQMPNGTGKTTTLHLLRAALSGAAESDAWTSAQVRGLAKRGNENGTGFFRVVLLVDGRRVTISLNFDFDQGTVKYTTTLTSGMKAGFRPPQSIEKFLMPDFVNFFVFDGELAEHLLSRQHTDAQTVIENLFQLSLFTEVAGVIGRYYDDQTDGRSATEEKGLSRRRNRVGYLRSRLAQMKREKSEWNTKFETTKRALTRNQAQFEAALEKQREHGERVAAAQLQLSTAHSAVERLAQEVLGRFRDPYAVASALGAELMFLKTSLDRVKLPESTAREFFEELAEEEQCVCGRELTDEFRQMIRERAKHYLGSDDVSLLNALKTDISSLIGPEPSLHEKDLDGRLERLLSAIRHEDECQTVYNGLETEAVAGDPRLQKAKEEIERLQAALNEFDSERQKYDSVDDSAGDDRTFGIRILDRRLEDAERKLAEITDTISLRRRRDVLIRIMANAREKARLGISEELCREANERIGEVMPDNAIRIQSIDRCLVLEGQEGGSAGETLSVAYAFLATLFNRVEHQLPFVVDSPANPIDLRVRAKVAELIPKLTEQFVAFTISSERMYFIEPLEESATPPVQFFTLFRKGSADLDRDANREPVVEESFDGILVSGRDFFCRFHIEKEEYNHAVSAS